MNLKTSIYIGTTCTAILTLPILITQAEDAKPTHTIKEVMKNIHKGDDNIGKRVAKGQASKEDIAKMVEFYAALPQNEPPRGEKSSWNEKVSALVVSARAVQSGKEGAIDMFKNASNCKACHSLHKPEEKK